MKVFTICIVALCAFVCVSTVDGAEQYRCMKSDVAEVFARCENMCRVSYDLVDLEKSSCISNRKDECVCKVAPCLDSRGDFAARCYSKCKGIGSILDLTRSTCEESDAETGCVCLDEIKCAAGDRDYDICEHECATTDAFTGVAELPLQVDASRAVCNGEAGANTAAVAKCHCARALCDLFLGSKATCEAKCAAQGRSVDMVKSNCVDGDIDECVCELPSCLREGLAVQNRRTACAESCAVEGKVADWSQSDCSAAGQCVCKIPCKPVLENLHYVPGTGLVSTVCDADAGDDCNNPTVRDAYGNDLWVRTPDSEFTFESAHMTEQICEPVA